MKQYSTKNPQLINWLGGIALGAMSMYLADPAQGKRRRLQVREKMRAASSRAGNTIGQAVHDTGNRIAARRFRMDDLLEQEAIDDSILQERVRSAVRKLASLPEMISVKAEQGRVTLSGLVGRKERNRLLQKLRGIPGVIELRDHLETGSSDRGRWFRQRETHRAEPEQARALAHDTAQAGGSMMSAARRLPIGPLLTVAGLGYAIRSLTKSARKRTKPMTAAAHPQVVHLQKSIEIQASPETVFNIWSKYDNFPQFMSQLVEIQSHGAQHSHWLMKGPAGVNLEWDVVLTKYLEPTMLAWKTEPGASIEHNGSVRFESSNGGTRATVRMFYGPGPGRRSDSLTALLGDDPERELEDDLERMKSFIEGKGFSREFPQTVSSSGQVLH
ncbi:MAG: SRPBCC family protein [Burkholderiaceae bacterium]